MDDAKIRNKTLEYIKKKNAQKSFHDRLPFYMQSI